MKKILLLTGLLVCAMLSFAQVDPKERGVAMQLVESNKVALGLSSADLNDVIVHTAYQIPNSDIRMVYLQQSYKGIPVYNQLHVLAFRNGKLVSNAGGFLSTMSDRTRSHSGTPAVSSVAALNTALRSEKIVALEVPNPISSSTDGRKHEFGKLGVSTENISAELVWLPMNEGKEVKLVWQVFVAPRTSSDYWLIRVDASTNEVINKFNLTVTCNWDHGKHSVEEHYAQKHFKDVDNNNQKVANYVLAMDKKTNQWQYRPFVVNNATYRVIRYPAESPQHPGGGHQTHTNPWTWAPGNATSLGWHFDGTTYYDSTRGNNVFAYEDAAPLSDNAPGRSPVSTTPQPDLTLDFTPDFTVAPTQRSPVPNQQFNTTNLFYWNNLMHDISYVYGFTESARNFQNDNQGRGGLGVDYVQAEAQDGSGTNNANFATPADGTRPRMQMFLWTTASPQLDGDVDNGIIAHEYTHGISNRLTGTGIGCLGNTEQMGEGWSDYYSLMVTHNWATAVATDGFNNPRGIGTYALAQPVTGPGIRTNRYTTNMAVNPLTYANLPTQAVPHGVGTIWCTALWEMTWEIIQQAGINPNLFNPAGGGGNAIALKLVQEGMRLQPCNPGFIDGRNAILRADTLFFGAQYSCAIIRAFAKRGMGIGASQGSSGSISDQVVSFDDGGSAFTLTQSLSAVQELQNITYTQSLTASCEALTNWTLTDTLPTHVTWVSGGSYNPANRVVTFNPVNVGIGATQTYQFTVNVNAGSYFPPQLHIDDQVVTPPPTIPAQWTAASTTVNQWVVSATSSRSAPNAYFTNDPAIVSDQTLTTTAQYPLSNLQSALHRFTFWHRFVLENTFDGGVIEISTNNGGTWTDLGPHIISGGYNGVIDATFGNPLAGRPAWTGNSGATFQQVVVNLNAFKGQNVKIRFRMGSDVSVSGTGWFVDDIQLRSSPVVIMKSNLFNQAMVQQDSETVIADIISNICVPPTINTQPTNQLLCNNGNALFTVGAVGDGITYQWQLSTDGGGTWNPIAGATNASYSIAGATSALNGRLYRVVITGTCGTVTSNPAAIHVSTTLTHTGVAATPPLICGVPASTSISGTANGGTVGTNVSVASSGTLNTAIPDNTPAGINSAVTAPTFTFTTAQNLKVRVNLTHTWVGDLRLQLTSPCGVTFVFDRPGVPAATFGNSADLVGVYIFDLAAATIIPETGGGTVAVGNYIPSNTAGAAHQWAGVTFPCNAAGTWTLNVSDNGGGDTGTLVDWALFVGGGYSHTLTGPGTITQAASTGTNNATGNFNVSGLPVGTHTFTLTSRDALGCAVSSNVNVVVGSTPQITTQPSAVAVCAGTNATFNVAVAATTLSPTYQWQLSTNFGVTWNNVPGATAASYTVVAPTSAQNGHQYRVIINSTCGSTTSNAVTLTVNPTPIHVATSVTPQPVCEGQTVTVSATAQGGVLLPTSIVIASSGNVNLAIPDASAAGVNSNITMPTLNYANASDLKVRITAAHSWVGDVAFRLTSPCGVTFLFDRPGVPASGFGNADNLGTNNTATPPAAAYIFDLTAATILPETAGANGFIAAGNYQPSTAAGAGHTWAGLTFPCAAAGTWTLNASDAAGGDVGTLVEWAIMGPGPAVYQHAMTGPGTITQQASTGPNGATGVFTVTGLPGGTHVFNFTTTTGFGCAVTTPITVNVTGRPQPIISPAAPVICAGTPTTLTILDTTRVVTGGGAITINASGNATPYGSTLAVAGLPASAIIQSVSINGFNHTFPDDVDMVLVSPTGVPVILMSDVGGAVSIPLASARNFVFRDGAPLMADAAANASGTYRPTNFVTPDNFPAPGPGNLTQAAPALSTMTGNVNGNWNLYVVDDLGGDAGSIASWSLTFALPGATTVTYTWSPATGLNVTTGATVIANPATTTTYTVTATNTLTGCTNTATVLVTVNQLPAITVQPTPATQDICPGNNVTYTVTATGTGITYQWRKNGVALANGGNISGATTNSLTITNVQAADAATYDVVVSGVCPPAVTSNPLVLRVGIAPTITTQPVNRTVCSGQNTTFSVVANVIPSANIGYQWQVSTDGGTTWVNLTGATPGAFMSTLSLNNVTTAMSGNRYRVIITSFCGMSITSNAAILTVNAAPVVTATDLWQQRICISDSLIPLNGTPVGGTWSGIGVSGNNFIPPATSIGTYVLTYSFTSANGCTVTDTTAVIVRDCPERIIRLADNAVILYPNPNNGRFNIRINSTLYNYLGMRVHTTDGALVKVMNFGGLVFGRVVPIDLSFLPSATYMVTFYYDNGGVRTSSKTFKVVVAR